MLNIYVTSSEKGSGKTFVSTGIAATMQSLGYSTSVYKPIQTKSIENKGFLQSSDLARVKSIDPYINTHFTYLYKENLEPLIAAEMQNDPVDIDIIVKEYKKIQGMSDCTIIDGDCGIMSPLAPNFQNADLINRLSVPLLIVTKPGNDCINNTLMTVNSALQKNITVKGVVINNVQADVSKSMLNSIPRIIEEYTNVKVLGIVPSLSANPAPEDVITAILNGIDIESVFGVKIEKLDLS